MVVKLQDFLNGHIPIGLIHLFGKAGAGKTTMALAAATACTSRGEQVAWIDTTGGFSKRRFMALGRSDSMASLVYAKARNGYRFDTVISKVMEKAIEWRLRLLVIDTIHGAIEDGIRDVDHDTMHRAWMLVVDVMSRLFMLTTIHPVSIILTNTMGFKPSSGGARPTGENIIGHFETRDVLLDKPDLAPGTRTAIQYLATDDKKSFRIVDRGIEVID
ncbi:hypothetical protein GF325_11130 [Candidatus Bathyarchaeota archaeon]|nr:hypothetical protein [Candidatus Bathyarchaeota archaeon]